MKKILAVAAISGALVLGPAAAALAYSAPAGPNQAAPNSVADYTFSDVPGAGLNVTVDGPGTAKLASATSRTLAVVNRSVTAHIAFPSQVGTYVITGSNDRGYSTSISVKVVDPTADVQLATHALADAGDPSLASTGLDAAPYVVAGVGAIALGGLAIGLVAWRRRSAQRG